MKIIKDSALNAELQELYLSNKQWLADLDFLEMELVFLRKRFGESFSPLLSKEDEVKMAKLLAVDLDIDQANILLKDDVKAFLSTIEKQLTKDNPDFDISLVNRHEQLIKEVTGLMQAHQLVKSKIFALGKKALASDPLSIAYS